MGQRGGGEIHLGGINIKAIMKCFRSAARLTLTGQTGAPWCRVKIYLSVTGVGGGDFFFNAHGGSLCHRHGWIEVGDRRVPNKD